MICINNKQRPLHLLDWMLLHVDDPQDLHCCRLRSRSIEETCWRRVTRRLRWGRFGKGSLVKTEGPSVWHRPFPKNLSFFFWMVGLESRVTGPFDGLLKPSKGPSHRLSRSPRRIVPLRSPKTWPRTNCSQVRRLGASFHLSPLRLLGCLLGFAWEYHGIATSAVHSGLLKKFSALRPSARSSEACGAAGKSEGARRAPGVFAAAGGGPR